MKRSLKNFGNAQNQLSNCKLRNIKGGNNDTAGTYNEVIADSEDSSDPNSLLNGGNTLDGGTTGTSKDIPKKGRFDVDG